jgi:hypothetical protein
MNARTWTSWCSAAVIAGAASAGDGKSVINYNLAESGLPTPTFLKSAKPTQKAEVQPATKAQALAPRTMSIIGPAPTPVPSVPELPAPTVKVEPPAIVNAPPAAVATKEPGAPVLPLDPPPKAEVVASAAPAMQASRVEMPNVATTMAPALKTEPSMPKPMMVGRAVATPATAPQWMPITPVAAVLPSADDHVKCVECLKILSGSPIESDRKAALAEMAKLHAWKQMKSSYMILRRVALTEYNTKMRADAVKLFGEAMTEHALAADTLKLSAQYDSDPAIRSIAMAQLERLAATPPDRLMR